jgi:hypothetical protein
MKTTHRARLLLVTGSLISACGPAGGNPKAPTATLAAPPPSASAEQEVRAPVAGPLPAERAVPHDAETAPKTTSENGPDLVSVTLTNPLAVMRARETIVLAAAEIGKVAPHLDLKKTVVVDAAGNVVLSQLVDVDGDDAPDQILFQTDLAANETKSFKLRAAERHAAPRLEFKAYGRFVRERHDDFAWENDLVAHRIYGPDLETAKKEPLVSSGVDVWAKRVPRLVVNDWYMTDDYHRDQGEGADFYSVGKSRGCGGVGVWAGGKLRVSKNFTTSRVIANGPIRLIFELTYAPWDVGGTNVGETKRITLDAGSYFNRFESTLTGRPGVVSLGLGIAKHPDASVQVDTRAGWMRSWEPLDGGKSGNLGCAILSKAGVAAQEQQTETDHLLVVPAKVGSSISYYVGTAWDRAGGVADAAGWGKAIENLAARLDTPVKVSVAALSAP